MTRSVSAVTTAITEWHNVEAKALREEPLSRPAVLRGVVCDWPVVQHALGGPSAVCDYLKQFDKKSIDPGGKRVSVLVISPEADGLVSWSDDGNSFTFTHKQMGLSAFLNHLLAGGENIAMQGIPISECLPGLSHHNMPPLLQDTVPPRIWMGNHITVPAHYDKAHNIAACVSGRRRFTLFPPKQAKNLYVKLDNTPAGAPTSIASRTNPDLDKYPKYRDALTASTSTELEPGDAIYIPAGWWHQVESIGDLNILINYWWTP